MACQGCGRTSETRLCCPTCVEFGRTSFFCSQECFTKNWNAHNQLHELLKRKRVLAEGSTGDAERGTATGGAVVDASGVASASGGSSGSTAVPSSATACPTTMLSSGGLAPLPGGLSMLSGTQKRNPVGGGGGANCGGGSGTSGAMASGGTAASGPGVFGSLVGQAKAMFGGTPAAAANAMKSKIDDFGSKGLRPRSPAANRSVGGTAQRRSSRSQSRDPPGGRVPGQPAPRARQFNVQMSLWALVIVTVTAGYLFFREHQRYVQDTQLGQGVIAELPDNALQAVPPAVPMMAGSDAVAAAAFEAAATAAAARAGADDAMVVSTAELSIRSEISVIKQSLERQDKMLRYIMDRYVEKNLASTIRQDLAAGATSAAEHDASAVNMSAPEFVSASYGEIADEQASKSGDALRKRRGGTDIAGDMAMQR